MVTILQRKSGCHTNKNGMADTQMQREIREKHSLVMGDHHGKFIKLNEDGKLLKPEQPGHVIAKLALEGGNEFSGQFLEYVSSLT